MINHAILDVIMETFDDYLLIFFAEGKFLEPKLKEASQEGFIVKDGGTFIKRSGNLVPLKGKKTRGAVYRHMEVSRGKYGVCMREVDYDGNCNRAALIALLKGIHVIRCHELIERKYGTL